MQIIEIYLCGIIFIISGSDLYIGFALSGAVELPAVFITYCVIQRAGQLECYWVYWVHDYIAVLRIRDPGSGAFLPQGSGIRDEFFPDPGSRIPDP
jgi:hypothetical protein